ncbi:ABC transporter substrate-binding protein [Microterricola pindariensis]|uniref:ABC transporter substrate-binding protein n=1 Tax=Microterricola pindariensis TaxID=478010 RepID=A0ABX5AZZ9_9MICO|nr:extracellular solute-binding protein [Microterricola pindariensis]PPL20120.1 ABC transporter substrate-binding protein [Microterricola pindariensis]
MKSVALRTMGIAAAATMLFGVTACSTGPATSGEEAGPNESITIDYLHRLPDGEGMTKVADIIAEWNTAHPDVQVTATKFDGKAAEMLTKLKADVKAGSVSCLAQLGYSEVPTMYTEGMLENVTDLAQGYVDNFSAGAVALMTVNGETVGLPQDTGPLVYYYNAAEFERLGLTVPTTADELAAATTAAAAAGKYAVAFQPDEAQYWLSGQTAAAGAAWFTAEDGKWSVDVSDAGTAKVASFWQGLIDTKSTLVANRWGDEFKQALVDQTLIGTIGAAWEAPLLAGDMAGSANEGQWAVVELPTFGATQMTGPDGGSGVAVMKGCAHPAEAMDFNNWFNTQIDPLVSQGLVVAAKGAMTTPDSIKSFYGGQDVFSVLAAANESLSPDFIYIPGFPAVNGDMVKAADAAGQGTAPVMDIFTAAQTSAIAALTSAGLPVAK